MKSNLAILSGKLAEKTSKLMGKGGSNIPGVVARKIDKQLLEKLSKQVENIIFVTGTNGKTTTANLLASILEAADKRVMNNAEGANLITGITACFVKHADVSGHVHYDYAVIEVDEATLPVALKQIQQPKMIVVNNFFRDQLDRYGEIDILIDKMMNGIKPIDTKLILNGDDPFTVRFSTMDKETVFFGLHKASYHFEKHEMSDSKYCPSCGKELAYDHTHYGQLGYFSCDCGYQRPSIQYEVEQITKEKGFTFQIADETYHMNLSGIHNVYNALSAISVAKELGISKEHILKGLEHYKASNGRMQEVFINHQTHIINLAKNHTGFNITLEEVLSSQEEKQISMYLNDLDLDGTDISWIWDADFERMNREDIRYVICSGIRAHDLAIRCKYAGVDEQKIIIIEDKEKAVEQAIKHNLKTYHIPNYTALEPVRKTLLTK